MKNLLFFLFFLPLSSLAQKDSSGYSEILIARELKLKELLDTSHHVLTTEDLDHFQATDYFQPNGDYVVTAWFNKKKGRRFKMPTSTDRTPVYRRYGTITFDISGVKCQLTVYQNMELRKKEGFENYLFIPLRDETSGNETYGGGRYLDFTIPNSPMVTLDFNLLYNPYCAYSHRYSCPIPPIENTLNVPILAGEKTPLYK